LQDKPIWPHDAAAAGPSCFTLTSTSTVAGGVTRDRFANASENLWKTIVISTKNGAANPEEILQNKPN
jgi:hypothetical protein